MVAMMVKGKFHGERLEHVRLKRGIAQKKLAEMLSVEPNTVYSYESGIVTPSVPVLINIAEILDISVDYLLGFIDIELSPSDNRVIRLPDEVSEESIVKIKELIGLYLEKDMT